MARKPSGSRRPAAARKTRAKRKPGKRKTRGRGGRALRRLFAYGLLGLLVVGAGYVAYLDFEIRGQFEGRRWELPARVYARPLELYAGRQLTADDLQYELKLLGYRPVRRAQQGGTFARDGQTLELATRAFQFWDGPEQARRLRVGFSGGQVASLADAQSGRDVALARLDPVLVGSIYPAHNEDRILVRLEDVPETLTDALIAVEDRQFYDHHGIAPSAVARAVWANLRAGRTVQGGSTITQQLVKNFFLTSERTLRRKLNEAVMALLLEWHYDKNAILEAYLNEVYLGQDGRRSINGFGLASQFYFQRPLSQLRAHEVALLVGMIKGPSYYDPRRHPERARQRRDLVLSVMAEQGLVEAPAAAAAQRQPLGVSTTPPSGATLYPNFVDLVRRQLRSEYRDEDLSSEGLQIFTTLDPLMQRQAEEAVERQLRAIEAGRTEQKGQLQSAVVAVRTGSGEVVALVGGRDGRYAGFNRALDAVRPIGSLVKPAVYLTALQRPQHYTLATLLDDGPLAVRNHDGSLWEPGNYDHRFHGRVPLALALAHSYNVSTARLGMELGVEQVVKTLEGLGMDRSVKPYPSVLLGSVNLSPLEVAQLYQTVAAGGFRTPLRSIRAVLDAEGQALSSYPLTVQRAFDETTIHLLTRALQLAVSDGTGAGLYAMVSPSLRVAGKTGTTDDTRDSWFAGFTEDYLAVAWIGRDDNRPTGLSGSTGALRVWGALAAAVQPTPLDAPPPGGIESVWVDPATGLRSEEGCEGAVRWPFLPGSAPAAGAECRGGSWLQRLLR